MKYVCGRRWGLLVASVCVGIIASLATAQAVLPSVTRVAIEYEEEGGWRYAPVTRQGEHVGILAYRPSGPVYGSDFGILWFEPSTAGAYRVFGCQVPDLSLAVEAVRERTQFSDAAWQAMADVPADFSDAGVEAPPLAAPFEDVFVPMLWGVAESDPLQSVAEYLEPQELELSIRLGAMGAVQLSAEIVAEESQIPFSNAPLFTRLDGMLADAGSYEMLAGQNEPASGIFFEFCWGLTETFHFSILEWDAPAFLSLTGKCKYTGVEMSWTRTCKQRWDCSLYDCVESEPTPQTIYKVCPSVDGECPPPPPSC